MNSTLGDLLLGNLGWLLLLLLGCGLLLATSGFVHRGSETEMATSSGVQGREGKENEVRNGNGVATVWGLNGQLELVMSDTPEKVMKESLSVSASDGKDFQQTRTAKIETRPQPRF